MQLRRKMLVGFLVVLLGLWGALAWRIHTWGQPLPVAYQRVAITPANPGGGRSFTYLRADDGPEAGHRINALDTNADGTIDLALVEGSRLSSFARPRPDDPEARWLVVCLDGVPYEEMLSLWVEGYFREFFRPVPLVSTFPSDSEAALSDAFHAGRVPGYEHRYFDRSRNQLAGGTISTLSEENIPYLHRLDYDMGGMFKGLTYVLPRKSYRADLGRLRTRFLQSREKIYLAHIASSDSLYHILPREEMRRRLIEVDSLLRELYFDAQGKLRITVFSDHGNSLVKSRAVRLEDFLAWRGWRLYRRLKEAGDVVVPAYGLVGFLAVYCAPEKRAALARDLAQMEGVDLAVYSGDGNSVVIEGARGQAQLWWNRDASAFRYEPLSADPLELARVLARLEQEGKVDAAGWVKDADFFRATKEHAYPDPADRLRQWATNHVHNRADVLVSLRSGYFYGSRTFQWVVDILSTHGSLGRAQSLGFAMSTDEPWEEAVRSRDLLPGNLMELKRATAAEGTGEAGK